MTEKTGDLIAEARRVEANIDLAGSLQSAAMIRRLADALASVRAERDAARAEIESRIEDRDYWHGVATRAKDQRDAAVAAVERVRAAIAGPHPANSGLSSFTLAHVLAALDGAPEPEPDWEISYEYADRDEVDGFMCECPWTGGCSGDSHRREVRRGPWLPVDGEKP